MHPKRCSTSCRDLIARALPRSAIINIISSMPARPCRWASACAKWSPLRRLAASALRSCRRWSSRLRRGGVVIMITHRWRLKCALDASDASDMIMMFGFRKAHVGNNKSRIRHFAAADDSTYSAQSAPARASSAVRSLASPPRAPTRSSRQTRWR